MAPPPPTPQLWLPEKGPRPSALAVVSGTAGDPGARLQAWGWGVCECPLLPNLERGPGGEGQSHSWLLSGPGGGVGLSWRWGLSWGGGQRSFPHTPPQHTPVSPGPGEGPVCAEPSWGEGLDLCPQRPQGKGGGAQESEDCVWSKMPLIFLPRFHAPLLGVSQRISIHPAFLPPQAPTQALCPGSVC